MITGTTRSGFVFSIDDNAADNMELIDALADMQNESDILAVSRVTNILLGPKQKKALYDHLRLSDGRVPVEAVSQAVIDIFTSNSKTKN